jgi:2-dehydropantoate 2-reductase
MTRILVLGAGGVGGYYGGRLADAGADVTFLVRPHRREQLVRDGLRIDSPLGNLARPVNTVLAADLTPDYDVVLLTCKAYDLESSMDAIAPAVGGNCAVVPILNGLAHLDRLDVRFGSDRVVGGTCGIDVMLLPDGMIRHTGALQRIAFGERNRERSERCRSLADAFSRTSLEWEWADDILMRMWEKIVLLSALAATTCLFRGNVHEIMAAPGGREAAGRALAANVEIARREGYRQSEQSVRYTRERLTDPEGRWSASMMRDMEGGRPVEADHIIGFMLDRARAHGVDDMVLSLAYTHLKTYECRRAEGRLSGA